METGKSVARLRRLRELLGRTGREDEGEESEAGFTLIELMVVLLIMGILLAIAIPTFLSVTGGAKKTAAQSNLTDSITSLTAIYTSTEQFPTETKVITKLTKTQNTIKYVTATVNLKTAYKGKNGISVDAVTATLVVLAAYDGAGVCWVAADNQSNTPSPTGVPAGNQFWGKKTTTCAAATMLAAANAVTPATGWKPNFDTIKTLT